MAGPTGNERSKVSADIAAAARDRGREQIEGAKGQLADEADRIASAVDRTADEIEGEGDSTISGFGHSVASLMRQLSGGLRERDVDEFARELGALARRNPGVFLAGSVALGFGVARFFKAETPQSADYDGRGRDWRGTDDWQGGGWQSTGQSGWTDTGDETWRSAEEPADTMDTERDGIDAEERLDLSAGSNPTATSRMSGASDPLAGMSSQTATRDEDRNSKSRQAAKGKVKPQRASSQTPQADEGATSSTEQSSTDAFGSAPGGSTNLSDTGGGTSRGGQ